MNNRHYRLISRPILSILLLCDSWLVGSGAIWYAENKEVKPKDLDIIIHPNKFLDACKIINNYNPEFNSFGGLKINIEDDILDIWPMELGEYINGQANGTAIRFKPYKIVKW